MAKVLVIKGHPLSAAESRTLKGLDHFMALYRALHPNDNYTFLDVFNDYVPEVDKNLLEAWGSLGKGGSFNDLSEAQKRDISRFNELTELFLESDKIIIANPLWNLNLPARLKAWIDTIVVSGKTFRYTETGAIPLTEGKKVFHIQSNGGFYRGEDPGSQYLKTILSFIGVKDIKAVYIEGLDWAPDRAEELLAEGLEKLSLAVKDF